MMWKVPGAPPMSDAQAAKWANVRTRGRLRYVLMTGVLAWGVPVAVLSATLKHLFFADPAPFWGSLAVSLVLFSVVGFFAGGRMWSANERRYMTRRPGDLSR